MATISVAAQVLDTIMSIPGMNDIVKIDMRISRKNVLLLNRIIEKGILDQEHSGDSILSNIEGKELEDINPLAGRYSKNPAWLNLVKSWIYYRRASDV